MVVSQLREMRGPQGAAMISFDSYYRDQGHLSPTERAQINYDHPDSLDGTLMVKHLDRLRQGQQTTVPTYDFATHTRNTNCAVMQPADVIVVEGILLYAFREIVDRLDYRVFRRCPESVRFQRRMKRDVRDRGRTQESVLDQLDATVKPMHDRFVEPYASLAHCVTEHGHEASDVATKVIAHIESIPANAVLR